MNHTHTRAGSGSACILPTNRSGGALNNHMHPTPLLESHTINKMDRQANKIITLQSSDGVEFPVSIQIAMQSKLVKDMLDNNDDGDDDDDDDDDDEDNIEIPLPRVDGEVLAKVVEFCNHYNVQQMIPIKWPFPNDIRRIVEQDWYLNFVQKMDNRLLLKLMAAAEYMNIPQLLRLSILGATFGCVSDTSLMSDLLEPQSQPPEQRVPTQPPEQRPPQNEPEGKGIKCLVKRCKEKAFPGSEYCISHNESTMCVECGGRRAREVGGLCRDCRDKDKELTCKECHKGPRKFRGNLCYKCFKGTDEAKCKKCRVNGARKDGLCHRCSDKKQRSKSGKARKKKQRSNSG